MCELGVPATKEHKHVLEALNTWLTIEQNKSFLSNLHTHVPVHFPCANTSPFSVLHMQMLRKGAKTLLDWQ